MINAEKIIFLKNVVFLFPFLIVATSIIGLLDIGFNEEILVLVHEDGIVEFGTSITYYFSSIVAFLICFGFIKKNKKIFGILFFIVGFIFLLGGFEEINWGQRILGIQTPEFFSSNYQNELNFHNLEILYSYPFFYFTLSGLLGTFTWLILPVRNQQNYNLLVRLFVPRWFLMTYFFPIFVFWFLRKIFPNDILWNIGNNMRHEEFFELLLALGFLFLVINSFLKRNMKFDERTLCEQFQEKNIIINFFKNRNKTSRT